MDRKKAIKIALVRSGITQDVIAQKLHLNKSTVSNVIAGRTKSARVEKELNEILNKWGSAI